MSSFRMSSLFGEGAGEVFNTEARSHGEREGVEERRVKRLSASIPSKTAQQCSSRFASGMSALSTFAGNFMCRWKRRRHEIRRGKSSDKLACITLGETP